MLNDDKVFEELIIAIQNVNTAIPLPLALRPKLWNRMEVLDRCKDVSVLEREGEVPKNAYYVVKGFAMVYGYDERTDEYVWRIYRPGSIVALNCFMHRKKSMYTIKASKRALLWSVSADVMNEIYKEMEGMREFALQTSAEYDNKKERSRNILLALQPDDRVLKFYRYYKGLLPSKRSPVPDDAVASFLAITKYQLQRIRTKLLDNKLLKIRW